MLWKLIYTDSVLLSCPFLFGKRLLGFIQNCSTWFLSGGRRSRRTVGCCLCQCDLHVCGLDKYLYNRGLSVTWSLLARMLHVAAPCSQQRKIKWQCKPTLACPVKCLYGSSRIDRDIYGNKWWSAERGKGSFLSRDRERVGERGEKTFLWIICGGPKH